MPVPSPSLYPSPTLYPGGRNAGFTRQLQTSLAPLADARGDWQSYNAALGAMFEYVFALVADQGDPDDPANYQPGWSILLDPANCPTQFLPFLGTFLGIPIQPGTDDATARALINNEQGFQRGTPASILATTRRYLTGTQYCALLERTPNPYGMVLVVRPGEVLDLAGLTNAIAAAKPAGITFQIFVSAVWVLFQMEAAYASLTALESAFATVRGLENDQPGA